MAKKSCRSSRSSSATRSSSPEGVFIAVMAPKPCVPEFFAHHQSQMVCRTGRVRRGRERRALQGHDFLLPTGTTNGQFPRIPDCGPRRPQSARPRLSECGASAGGGSRRRILATQLGCHACPDQLTRLGAEATIFTTSLSCTRRRPAPLSSQIQKDEPSGIHSSMTPLPMWWPWLISSTWLPSVMNSNAAFIDSGSWLPVMGEGSLSRTIRASLRTGRRR
jgi:hypothetical protein